jgi:hypothetical protein
LEPLHGDLGHGRHDRSAAPFFFLPSFCRLGFRLWTCGVVVERSSSGAEEKGGGARVIYSRRSR